MKKILLASAAMVAFTGVASAEVTLSGSARFGLKYASQVPASLFSSTSLEKRMTINIDASTETDGGLELGGRIRIRSDEAAAGTGTAVNGARLFLKTGGFELAVGNISGAIDSMATTLHGDVGLDGNGYHNAVVGNIPVLAGLDDYVGYASTGNNNGIEAIYTAGGFKAHLSYAMVNDASAASNNTALALQYNFGDWTAELGLQDADNAGGAGDFWTLAVKGQLGDFGVGAAYGSTDLGVGTQDRGRINASYTMGATTMTAFVAKGGRVDTSYGIGATYDLGGATLVGGITKTGFADTATTSKTVASAGIKFNF